MDFLNKGEEASISFHCNGRLVGTLDFNGPGLAFTGDCTDSAAVFMGFVGDMFAARLVQERAPLEAQLEKMQREIWLLRAHCGDRALTQVSDLLNRERQ